MFFWFFDFFDYDDLSEINSRFLNLFSILGAEKGGSPVVFLFADAHVKDENFLEIINNMLTSGVAPALFPEEEKAPLIER